MSDNRENKIQKTPWTPLDSMLYKQETDPVSEHDQVFLKTKHGCIHPLVTDEAGSEFYCLNCHKDEKLFIKGDPELKKLLDGTLPSPCGDPSIRIPIGQIQSTIIEGASSLF